MGIPDGYRDIPFERGIIMEYGFDELNAIAWNKGCYMGQELTARCRYRGLIKKRLLSVKLLLDNPQFGAPIYCNSYEAGNLHTFIQNYGLAMIRLEFLEKGYKFSCGSGEVIPIRPDWIKIF
jgi:folate-binding protein YgfZ